MIRLFGIDIRFHWSWWALMAVSVLPELIALNVVGVLFTVWMFAWIIFLVGGHELAHALTARKYGYETSSIYFHLLGGVANLKIDLRKITQKEMFWIAFAGPLFNFVVAALMFPLATSAVSILIYPMVFSFLIGIFNLIPAYPLDGGRIFRSLLKMWGVRDSKAVQITQNTSLLFAILFVIGGAVYFEPFVFLAGLFIGGVVWLERRGATV